MNERGFVTVFALCLILVVALVVKGIQEAETNHNQAMDDLQAQFDLQNAADGGIYEAAEIVRSGQKTLPVNNFEAERYLYQVLLVTSSTKTEYGTIRVDVWGERLKIQDFNRAYTPKRKKVPVRDEEKNEVIRYGYVLFSVAELDSENFGKMYRRALAFVLDGYGIDTLDQIVEPNEEADEFTVHFMTLP